MYQKEKIKRLLGEVELLEQLALRTESEQAALLQKVHPNYAVSARNLVHYLAVRSRELRNLQEGLSEMGISSQSHAEGYTLHNLANIRRLLLALLGKPWRNVPVYPGPNIADSDRLLRRHTQYMFGKAHYTFHTRLMVTLPTEAAADEKLMEALIVNGMDVARINTAHDDPATWRQMVRLVHRTARKHNRSVKIYMDLAGPKMRTTLTSGKGQDKGITLYDGDLLRVYRNLPAEMDPPEHRARVSLTLPEVFQSVKEGQSIWFDDGAIGGVIQSIHPDYLVVEITQAPAGGARLKHEKGINLPDTHFDLPALTADDLTHLPLLVQLSDMIGYSFVRRPQDVDTLLKHLHDLNGNHAGIVLKVENKEAFDNLPSLLLTAMQHPKVGIMIARGDLAVEVGFLRMAEVQEEILWLAEAAHLPVIWATQVLDSLAKKGRATRAEISDAVKAVRAECAMLNKGPYIVEALATLKDIDARMAQHEEKKLKMLRPLNVARLFLDQRGS